jgi:DNA-binding NtrC family response regulator
MRSAPLSLHRWLGNVRELQNRVQRAVIMADGKRVTARDLELTDTLKRVAAANAEGSPGKRGTGNGSGRPKEPQREDHFRGSGARHQAADAV